MRVRPIVSHEYYHVLNRGNDKRKIFFDDRDYARFLFSILYFQSSVPLYNIGSYIAYFIKHRVFNVSQKALDDICTKRYVQLVGFTIMPNHFHLIVYGLQEDGIARYMQRILNSYTKYFNTKYKKVGHVFQGPYKAIEVHSERQLLYLSAYIHKNVSEIPRWKKKEHLYPWSSYQDFVTHNRWGNLLAHEIISDQFPNGNAYKEAVDASGAKENSP